MRGVDIVRKRYKLYFVFFDSDIANVSVLQGRILDFEGLLTQSAIFSGGQTDALILSELSTFSTYENTFIHICSHACNAHILAGYSRRPQMLGAASESPKSAGGGCEFSRGAR